jgi:protein-arginine kinase activator protein McsA
MERQCFLFDEKAQSIAIPINTMDLSCLKSALKDAVENENYELASQLRDEINRRHHERD